MSLLLLIGLVTLMVALAGTGTMLAWRPRALLLPPGTLCALAAVLALASALGGGSSALPEPFGPAGLGGGIRLGGLAPVVVLLAAVVGVAAEHLRDPLHMAEIGRMRLAVSATMLCAVAGDAFLFCTGALLAILVLASGARTRRQGRAALWAATGLVGACACLAASGARGAGLPLLHAAGDRPAGGMLAALLLLAASVPVLGIWPAKGWPGAGPVGSVWRRALGWLLGLFVPLHLVGAGTLDGSPGGLLLVLAGVAASLQAAAGGFAGRRLFRCVDRLATIPVGLALAGIGLSAFARFEALPVLAGTALDAVLMIVPVVVPGGFAALVLAADMEREAGAALLVRLGGLGSAMPRAGTAFVLAAAVCAGLPPLGGFTGSWLLIQGGLAACRLGPGWSRPAGLALLLAGIWSVVFGLAGWLRLGMVAVLGRPRTPRGAAALDAAPATIRIVLALLAVPLATVLLPGAWLRLAAPPAAAGRGGSWLVVASTGGGGAMSAACLLGLCGLGGVLAWRLRRGRTFRPARDGVAWEDGAPLPPPWLPFGDPLTQVSPATLPRAFAAAIGAGGPADRSGLRSRRVWTVWRSWRRCRGRTATQAALLLDRHGALLALALLVVVLAASAPWRLP